MNGYIVWKRRQSLHYHHGCSRTADVLPSVCDLVVFTQSRMGNWSMEVGGSALSWPRGSGLQVQARLDGREKIWLNGSVDGRCLVSTAGYQNGQSRITCESSVSRNRVKDNKS